MNALKSNISSHLNFAKNKGYLPFYTEAAQHYGIPVEILLAKDSRETWLGSIPGLIVNGWYGSDGVSRGISQININDHKFARETDPKEVRAYIAYGASVLKNDLKTFNGNYKAALAAYNTGPNNVKIALDRGVDPDNYTTEKNYSSDILNRAQLIRELLQEESGFNIEPSTASLGNSYWLAIILISSGAYYLWKKGGDHD